MEEEFSVEEQELIAKVADYIDNQAVAEGLFYNLKEAKEQAGLEAKVTFEELRDFWLFILEDLWEQAKTYIQTHYT